MRTHFARLGAAAAVLVLLTTAASAHFQQVTSDGGNNASSAWSPDGSTIVYVSRQVGPRHLFTVAAPGSEFPWQITSGPSLDYGPFWHPDGGSVWFHSDRAGGNIDIYSVPRVGGDVERCTTDGGVDENGDWSSDGQWIVLRSDETGDQDIVLRSADCTTTVPVVVGSTSDHGPSFSPDGTKIAFARGLSGSRDIWIYDLVLEAETQLTFESANIGNAAWSPDGAWIAYTSNQGGNFDIWRIPAAGGTPEQITTDSADDRAPSWSPTGDELVFASTRSGNWDLWVRSMVDLMSSPSQVTFDSGDDYSPAWSPDGNVIAFISLRDGNRDVWMVGAPGRETPKQLTFGTWEHFAPFWSPDQRWIGYHSAPTEFTQTDMYKMPGVGGAGIQLTFDPRTEEDGSWSSDGDWIAYNIQDAGGACGNEDILRVPADGGAPEVVLAIPGEEEQRPDWHPDGTKIAYTKGCPGSRDIWIYDLVTQADTRVTFYDGNVGRAKFSPDGVYLTYDYRASSTTDVFVTRALLPGPHYRLTDESYSDISADWAPDGRSLVFASDRTGGFEIWVYLPPVDAPAVDLAMPSLMGNFPNPFNPSTTIRFRVPSATHVKLAVYSIDGRLVRTLRDGRVAEGDHTVPWSSLDDRGQPVASGVYLVQLQANGVVDRAKLVLIK